VDARDDPQQALPDDLVEQRGEAREQEQQAGRDEPQGRPRYGRAGGAGSHFSLRFPQRWQATSPMRGLVSIRPLVVAIPESAHYAATRTVRMPMLRVPFSGEQFEQSSTKEETLAMAIHVPIGLSRVLQR
jgi:hypothetical protein